MTYWLSLIEVKKMKRQRPNACNKRPALFWMCLIRGWGALNLTSNQFVSSAVQSVNQTTRATWYNTLWVTLEDFSWFERCWKHLGHVKYTSKEVKKKYCHRHFSIFECRIPSCYIFKAATRDSAKPCGRKWYEHHRFLCWSSFALVLYPTSRRVDEGSQSSRSR